MKTQHKQRYAPYSLSRNPQRSNSLVDRVLLGFCKQLSKPLLSGTRADDDAFGAPWRTVDRETTELREEIYRAQCEAAALEAKRKQEIEKKEKKKQREIQRQLELKEQERKRKLEEEEEEKKRQLEKQRQLEEQERQRKLKEQKEEQEKIQRLKEQEEKKKKQEELERQRKLEEQERQRKLEELERQRRLEEQEEQRLLEEERKRGELEKQEQLEEQERKRRLEEKKRLEELEEQKQLEEQEEQQHQSPEMATPPRMESIFDTARKLAERKLAFFTPDGTPMKPKLAVASSYKGKGVEAPPPLDFGVGGDNGNDEDEDEDEEGDVDFDPRNASEYDDEEELLQGEMDPIDEYEEVTTPEMAHSPAAASQNAASPANDAVATPKSVEEPQEAADEVKVSVQFDDSDDNLVDDSVGVDSEEITQVITSMPSGEVEEEEKDEDDIFMTPRKTPAPSQRSWWPFSPRSLLKRMASEKKSTMSSSETQVDAEQVAAFPDQPDTENEEYEYEYEDEDEDEEAEAEYCGAIQSPPGLISPLRARHRINLHRSLEEEPLSHPYVPASFADVFKSPEVFKRPRSSSEQDAAAKKEPLPAKRPSVLRADEPGFSAASLGLETRHTSVGKRNSRYKRQNTSVYYGSGYGSQSIPYAFSLNMAQNSRKPNVVGSTSNEGTKNSSITAQKILDIIGDAPPPPAYSQQNLEIHDALNPHELTSFFAASLRSSHEPQRRRNLVPLSERLGQKGASSKHSKVDKTRSILDTIQAVAPPQVQARLGESKKSSEVDVQPATQHVVKEVNRKRGSTSVSSVRSESSNTSAQSNSTAFGASRMPVATSPSSLTARLTAKGQTTPKPLDQVIKQATTTATAAAAAAATQPTKSSRNIGSSLGLAKEETAVAVKGKEPSGFSPDFVFSLPLTPESPKSSEARKRAGELNLAELPVYAFALEGSAAEELEEKADTQEKNIFAKVAASNKKAGEWTCSLCMLSNPSTAAKCTICETDKPEAPVSEAKDNSSASPESISSSSSSGFKVAKPKDGEWTCNVCNLINPKTAAAKCTICDAARPIEKPAAAAAAATSIWELAAKTSSDTGQWECGLCMLKNSQSTTKCTVCEAPKPSGEGIVSATTTSGLPETIISANSITTEDAIQMAQTRGTKGPKLTSSTELVSPKDRTGRMEQPQLPLFDFDLDVSSKPAVPAGWEVEKEKEEPKDIFKVAPLTDGEWICDMCSLKNLPYSRDKCIACETPKK